MEDNTFKASGKYKETVIFWQKYRSSVISYGIPEKKAQWYEHWARQFALSIPRVPLENRILEQANTFLDSLKNNPNIEDWQLYQATEALKILYEDFLHIKWSQQSSQMIAPSSEPVKGLETSPPNQQPQSNLRTLQETYCEQAPSKSNYLIHQDIFTRLRSEMHAARYSLRTEKSYTHWVRRFINFYTDKSPLDLTPDSVKDYLEYLVRERKISAITQNQALNALVFFYEHVLNEPLDSIGDFTRAKQPQRLPTILTRDEVNKVLNEMTGVNALITGLLYGSGLRLMECLRLRVKDFDFQRKQITVRDGKGRQDRVTVIPERYLGQLQEHIEKCREQHHKDLLQGFGEAYIWPAVDRKYPDAARAWEWQYVFPSSRLSVDPLSKKVRRHHIHETAVQNALKLAAKKAGLSKQVNCQMLRHSFAAHLLEDGYDIQTVQGGGLRAFGCLSHNVI
ncbi:MAG: integron integrase [Nitrospirota bacterium]